MPDFNDSFNVFFGRICKANAHYDFPNDIISISFSQPKEVATVPEQDSIIEKAKGRSNTATIITKILNVG